MTIGDDSPDELAGLIQAAHLAVPDEIPGLLTRFGKRLGADEVVLYLVDYEQRVLVPVPGPDTPERSELVIDATLAGRCYRTIDIQQTATDGARLRMWVPVLDGVERLGVLELCFVTPDPDPEEVRAFAGLVAEVVVTKQAYGDLFERTRRRQPMSVGSELAWQLLPPLTFGTERLVISGVVAPVYDLGGDCFDYSVDARMARIALFDAMGHSLEAGLLASVAIAACRNSRRQGADIAGTAAVIDEAIATQFGPDRFVTGVLADLELGSGCLRWSVSGHPPPLLLRDGKIVKTLTGEVTPPLGIGGGVVVSEEMLEPADRVLFFTDGVVEARSAEGEFFGVERLVDMVSRTSAAATPAPETMRRLLHAILDHQEGALQDDATIVVVEWLGPGSDLLLV
jgi:hypothetical protein